MKVVIDVVCCSLVHISSEVDWETEAANEENRVFEELVVEMLDFIAKCIQEPKLYADKFNNQKRQFLVSLGFTFLKTTASEREKMISDSDDFVHLALDTCDKQKSGIIKTQAGKIIESFCDHIEGSTSFLAVFACKSLDWAL